MTEVLFNGHAGRLEGRYHQSDKPGAPIALILHPHPQYGGTMNNKVVYTLFSCFQNLGFSQFFVLIFAASGVRRASLKTVRASCRTQPLRLTGCSQ